MDAPKLQIDRTKYDYESITTDEAGREIGASRKTIADMVKAGKLRGHKVGNQLRIRIDEIERYLNS